MTLRVSVRPDDPTPPYEQVRSQVAAAIAAGALVAGTKLPPVRQLAGDLGVAAGTVARAYKELEAEQLVATARRAGTTVVGLPSRASGSELSAAAGAFVAQARRLGGTDDAILAAVEAHLGR